MQAFARLYGELDASTKTNKRVAALVRYFRETAPADAVWALYFLSGRRLKRLVTGTQLRTWIGEAADLPDWLVGECHEAAGDLGETITLLHPASGPGTEESLSQVIERRLMPLASMSNDEKRASVLDTWNVFNAGQRFLWNKLISGTFRVGVARTLVERALAEVAGVDAAVMAHRLMGDWEPTAENLLRIMGETTGDDPAKPYPFFLAHPLEGDVADLGDLADWQVEWKWDGIRSQLLRRGATTLLWSRGEEAIADRFPEIVQAAQGLPSGTVFDGEVLAWRDGAPLPFAQLQRRIGKLNPSAKLRSEVPVAFCAYDCLEVDGVDLRGRPLSERRAVLERIISAKSPHLVVSPLLVAGSWEEVRAARETARSRDVEGLMLKRLASPYGVGRVTGDWWKWKVTPLTIDAVLIAAQSGSGRRASLFTDYTFGVWSGDALVPMAKAYSGLTDAELKTVDAWIRRNTLEKHGPVRTVRHELVFELGFDIVQHSTRHAAGVAVRFPRILRWRTDKKPVDADRLESLRAMAGPAPVKEKKRKAEAKPSPQLDLFADAEEP